MTGVPSRKVALDVLVRIEADKSYANLALGPALERSGLDERDRRLVTELVYGTIRQQRACDFLVDRFLSSDPPPVARAALRMGAYQLHYTDIPDHAAVDATVGSVPKRFSGLVNAILRKVGTSTVTWPDDATRLSYPDWIVERLIADHGRVEALAALGAMNAAPEVTTRADGYVQDLASQWVAEAVAPEPGDVVVDLCAAPGGKATALAGAGAQVIAADIRPQRVGLIDANVERLGLDDAVLCVVADGLAPPIRPGSADHVLVDAPCSGLGVLRRRPDARWRATPDEVVRLAGLQRRLLDSALGLVAPGGTLVYSVCTLTRAETIDVAASFAADHGSGSAIVLDALEPPGDPWRPWGSGALILPQDLGTDGMAVFRWRVRSAP